MNQCHLRGEARNRGVSAALSTPPTAPKAATPMEPAYVHLKPPLIQFVLGWPKYRKIPAPVTVRIVSWQSKSWVLFKVLFFFPWAKALTSNLKKDLKVVVIHGDLWSFPREFQAPGLSSHNSQEMQLKISHRLLIQRVRVGRAGESPVSPREAQDSYGHYPKSFPKPGDVSENTVVLSWHYRPRSMIYYAIA